MQITQVFATISLSYILQIYRSFFFNSIIYLLLNEQFIEQLAEKRYRNRLKKNGKGQSFNRKTKKQLNKTHNLSQHMLETIEEDLKIHELDIK